MTARAWPARVDSALQHALCATPYCEERIASLDAPRGAAAFTPFGPARAAIRMSRQYRMGADSVWRVTAHARAMRTLWERGEATRPPTFNPPAQLPTAHLSALPVSSVPSEATGDGADIAQLRNQPPIPTVVECPRCARRSVITDELLAEVGRLAARLDDARAPRSTEQGPLGNITSASTPSVAPPSPPERQPTDRPSDGSLPGSVPRL